MGGVRSSRHTSTNEWQTQFTLNLVDTVCAAPGEYSITASARYYTDCTASVS